MQGGGFVVLGYANPRSSGGGRTGVLGFSWLRPPAVGADGGHRHFGQLGEQLYLAQLVEQPDD